MQSKSPHTNHLSKYLDYRRELISKSSELVISVQHSERTIKSLLEKAKQDEALGDFLVLSAKINELTDAYIKWNKAFMQEIYHDAQAVLKGAELRNQMRDHLDTITVLTNQREQLIKDLAIKQKIK